MTRKKGEPKQRTWIRENALCAVIRDGVVLEVITGAGIQAAVAARQAYQKYGPVRVLLLVDDEYACWREIAWKNKNAGTMYRRPSLRTIERKDVPAELLLAEMCL